MSELANMWDGNVEGCEVNDWYVGIIIGHSVTLDLSGKAKEHQKIVVDEKAAVVEVDLSRQYDTDSDMADRQDLDLFSSEAAKGNDRM